MHRFSYLLSTLALLAITPQAEARIVVGWLSGEKVESWIEAWSWLSIFGG